MGKIPRNMPDHEIPADRLASQFACAANERDILRAWENFLGGVAPVGPPVRVIVENSWKRSSNSGVNAHGKRTPVVMKEGEFYRLRERHRLLSAAAAPTLAQNAALLKGTRSMLILTDPTGVILDIAGDPYTIDSGQDVNLVIGGSWNEEVIGTNAIGTAIAIEQAVQVHASEHFCEGVKKWTCAAAPIRDPRDQSLLGVLDISGPDQSFCQHNLALALSAAKYIESALLEKLTEQRNHLLQACFGIQSQGDDGFVVLDKNAYVVFANENAVTQMDRGVISNALGVGNQIVQPGTTPTLEELMVQLPPEINSEWLHPVTAGDDTLGSVLVIPGKPARRQTKQRQSVADVSALQDGFPNIVGESEALTKAVTRARQLADSTAPILIEGETGVGKELFAQAIYSVGGADRGPLVSYNCGSASRDLIGSELFGYVKGAFTGASADGRTGRFEEAHGGTLCLDEIGEMPLDLQPYLLRVLDEGLVYRIGDNKPHKVDVRLLAMTNRNLREEVMAGRFRQDLFYRISVTTLQVPALRERESDIDRLIGHFNLSLAKYHRRDRLKFSRNALSVLRRYDWPGNVRELRNVVESLVLVSQEKTVRVTDLPAIITEQITQMDTDTAPCLKKLELTERAAIEAEIRTCRGNIARAAKQLGISRSTLYRKIEHYGVTS